MSQEAVELGNTLAPVLGVFLALMFLFLPDMTHDFKDWRERRRRGRHPECSEGAQRAARKYAHLTRRTAQKDPRGAEWEIEIRE